MLQVIAGPHGGTILSLQDDPPDYGAALDEGVAGMRMAWTDDFGFARTYAGPESEEVVDVARSGAQRFVELGAAVETTAESWEDWWPYPTVMMNPAGDFLGALSGGGRRPQPLVDDDAPGLDRTRPAPHPYHPTHCLRGRAVERGVVIRE